MQLEEIRKLPGSRSPCKRTANKCLWDSGFFAAMAGIILTSRLDSAQPLAGQGYELDAIAAVVLGGTSLPEAADLWLEPLLVHLLLEC
jgi:hypothetical protein